MRLNLRRVILTSLRALTLTGGEEMPESFAKEQVRTWQTEKVKLLDSVELINSTVRVLEGALPGTGKTYDAEQISDQILQLLMSELKDQRGVHSETALATLGALAGFSVQMALRETLIKPGTMPEDEVFVVVKANTGESFYLGDLLNEGLFGGTPGVYSVFAIVGDGVQKAGAQDLPDVNEIAGYVAGTLGSEKFGIPRLPAEHTPRESPAVLLDKFWNPFRNLMVLEVKAPLQWPFVLSLAAQKLIVMSKDCLDPLIAGNLVMEAATAMAKIDPAKVHYAYFQAH